MTLNLSYLSDLSRVRVALSSITPDGAVQVQRSANAGEPWQTVRGGVALPIVSGIGQLDDYEFFADVLNTYRVLRVTPLPGLVLTGASGVYANTPDAALLDITGDLDISAYAALTDWTSAAAQVLIGKWVAAGNQRSYRLLVTTTGRLSLEWSNNGTAVLSATTTDPIDVVDGGLIALRATLDVNDGSGNRVITFWSSSDDGGFWTQIESFTVVGTTSIFASTATLEVGGSDAGTTSRATGVVHSASLANGINGTVVADPDFAAQASGITNFSDGARTWTLQGAASIRGELIHTGSITPSLAGQTWLKSITYPALNRPIADPDYRPVQRSSRTGVYNIKGRVPPIAVHDAWTSQWWTIETVTENLTEARDMDLCIAAGGTYFVHTPAEIENECFTNPISGMPGGYVYILNSTMSHPVPGSSLMSWILPVRVVAPPAPEIVGTTLTWAAAERLYGSWTALWASNATWRDLWSQIMDPDDAIVL